MFPLRGSVRSQSTLRYCNTFDGFGKGARYVGAFTVPISATNFIDFRPRYAMTAAEGGKSRR